MFFSAQRLFAAGKCLGPTSSSRGLWWNWLGSLALGLLPAGFALALLASSANIKAAEEDVSLAGTYRDERVVIELGKPQTRGARESYSGFIQLGEEKFPLRADFENGQLKGVFESQGDPFPFTASVAGRILVFTTEGTTYRLTRQSANPLAKPAKPNPLALPPVSPPKATESDAAVSEASTSPAPMPARGVLHLRRQRIMDDPAMIGGEAFSVLVPADWRVQGGLAWRMHSTSPAYTALRMANPNETEVLEALPAIPFVWIEGGIPLFPRGSKYMGNEVGEPINDPLAYIKQVVIPRFRQTLPTAQIAMAEELPRVADTISELSQESGYEKKFRAARMRLEYVEKGTAMEEDVYCVLAVVHVPALRATFWGPDRNYSFKAPKGKLDGRTPLFHAIVSSFKPGLEWQNRYTQLVQFLVQAQLNYNGPLSDLTQFIAKTEPEITEPRRHLFERQQVARERVNAAFRQHIRGLKRYRSPFDSQWIDLPQMYSQVWMNATGDCLLSEDARLDPRSGGTTNWKRADAEP